MATRIWLEQLQELVDRGAQVVEVLPEDDYLSSTGRRNAVWPVTLRVRRDDWACLGDAAVVVEARPEGGPERR